MAEERKNDKVDMSIQELVTNPTGKGSAYVYSRSSIRKSILVDFVELLRKYRKEFRATPYLYEDGNILFHVRVPSRDYKDNRIAYDVLYLLERNQQREYKHWNTRTFCNSPSFIYDYCYVYNKNQMLFVPLIHMLPSEALNNPPVIRNPIESLGFERVTQMAAHYLLDGYCLTDGYINRFGIRMTAAKESELFKRIADPRTIVSVYQYAKYKSRQFHRKHMDGRTKRAKEKQTEKFIIERKAAKAADTKLFRTAKSKITAKKATKALLNTKAKASRTIKPKQKIK